jgi:homoserine dehydrogenase
VLVDNTSSADWAAQYPALVRAGISIVTPNKKAFSSELELWDGIWAAASNGVGSGGFVFHESTVGAGLPVLSTLRELVETGDRVTRVEGVFSGTMSYLFNTWNPTDGEAGTPFSKVVRTARDLGYTEPDPRDDLNGLDVARKLTILARIAGLKVASPTSFPVQSLVPKELENVKSADEFLDGLVTFDDQIGNVKEEAKAEGKVVRFVGSVDVVKGDVKVGLEKYALAAHIVILA